MTSIYNKYSSIVPSEMTNDELRHMCTEIQVAKNQGRTKARVFITKSQREYDVPVANHKEYQDAFQTETGALKLNGK
jgi:hypothetical protein